MKRRWDRRFRLSGTRLRSGAWQCFSRVVHGPSETDRKLVTTQTDTIDRLAPDSRVAVIRLRSLGDCVLSTPALQLLRNYRPDLRVAVAVEDRFAAIFENPIPPTVRALREFAPDLCLNLHGGTRSARLTLLSGAKYRAGFDIFTPSWIYNTSIPTAQETMGVSRRVHTAEHAASAMFYLGVPIGEIPRAKIFAPEGRSKFALGRRYAVIHPLAATPEKTWPAVVFYRTGRNARPRTRVHRGLGEKISHRLKTGVRCIRRAAAGTGAPDAGRVTLHRQRFRPRPRGEAAFGASRSGFASDTSDAEIWCPWRTKRQPC